MERSSRADEKKIGGAKVASLLLGTEQMID